MDNTQFNANVYHFTSEMMKELLEKFNGKEVGSEEMDHDVIMAHFFGDFSPGDVIETQEDKVVNAKKKKKKKDPTRPKRPQTAFFAYTATIRSEVKEKNPGVPVSDLSKIHSKMWNSLSDDEKEPFHLLNQKDKLRYEEEMKVWNDKGSANNSSE
tara:strand:+ start:573 stop:1037 length:465 start_codon:yes stop_codon:yes gene_type:complete